MTKNVTKIFKRIVFCVGVDCLGFPLFHAHELVYQRMKFVTVYHQKYYNSKKQRNNYKNTLILIKVYYLCSNINRK